MLNVDTSNRREQRNFGLVMAGALTVLGLIRWSLHGFAGFPLYYLAVAAVFLVLGLAAPKALQPLFIVWMKLAMVLNWIVTHVLLGLAFYLMITPVRVLVKIFSDDPLKRAWLPDAATYWEDPEDQPEAFERYRDQY